MTSPLIRAAQAINPFAWYDDCADPEAYQRDAIRKARAVLEAIREPSDEGLEAFARAFNWNWRTHEGRENARHAWYAMIDDAMIDKALSE